MTQHSLRHRRPAPLGGGLTHAFTAGLRTLQATYLLRLPSFSASAIMERSFLLTAAGQLRILTGFPFQPQSRDGGTMKFTHYSKGLLQGQRQYVGVTVQILTLRCPTLPTQTYSKKT